MKPSSSDPAALFAEALSLVEEELPWQELGPLYCHEGGESFFEPAQVDALREAGLKIAADVATALESTAERRAANPYGRARMEQRPGVSLYFGAALAELVPALCERVVLGREVRLLNLPGPEATLINGALARAEERLNERRGLGLVRLLPRIELDQRALESARFDHLWLTSVLTDPDTFPALHDELYDLLPRKGKAPAEGKEPTGRGNLPAERKRARELVRKLVGRLDVPGALTTTDEEVELLRAALEERGLNCRSPQRARLSAIVGDPIRSYQVSD